MCICITKTVTLLLNLGNWLLKTSDWTSPSEVEEPQGQTDEFKLLQSYNAFNKSHSSNFYNLQQDMLYSTHHCVYGQEQIKRERIHKNPQDSIDYIQKNTDQRRHTSIKCK